MPFVIRNVIWKISYNLLPLGNLGRLGGGQDKRNVHQNEDIAIRIALGCQFLKLLAVMSAYLDRTLLREVLCLFWRFGTLHSLNMSALIGPDRLGRHGIFIHFKLATTERASNGLQQGHL